MSTNNNVFANKIMTVYDELFQTHNLLASVIVNLERCSKEGDDVNLTKEIGSYMLQMPEFLTNSPLTTCLRNIYTREVAISDALVEAQHYLNMLKEALNCFDEAALYRLSHENDEKAECSCNKDCSSHECKCGCKDGCKCGNNCECDGGCGCGCECECECERDSKEEYDENSQKEDFHLEISIKGSKNVLSALFM